MRPCRLPPDFFSAIQCLNTTHRLSDPFSDPVRPLQSYFLFSGLPPMPLFDHTPSMEISLP